MKVRDGRGENFDMPVIIQKTDVGDFRGLQDGGNFGGSMENSTCGTLDECEPSRSPPLQLVIGAAPAATG
ncbi:hypothetical protein GGR90_003586 [Sphingopyxis italica]|uniref:Uncharacterized protein n=1 Tax=Sphingopyxis italica TaxID=1129133 RepID=A0A7X5XU61_9SPHN|nr:hypothetical protein [Sphingopyxis italica]NJB91375.1 hypothetical protein [Sphingopyxis italica]